MRYRRWIDDLLQQIWYGHSCLAVILAPLGKLYAWIVGLRQQAYHLDLLSCYRAPMPVIVVGNLTIGGTGKTPFVIWLAKYLISRGYRPGILSRGYGVPATESPRLVDAAGESKIYGDEPILLARQTGCPVVLHAKRALAAQALLQRTDCNIILCDDGLQHLALARDIEILLIDGTRRFGNQRCLPAGPLREPIERLQTVDILISNGRGREDEYTMRTLYKPLVSVQEPFRYQSIATLSGNTVHAVAGLGNPERFFAYLEAQQIKVIRHSFPDHYRYKAADIQFADGLPVLMSEKDAVKCKEVATAQHWFLPITVELPAALEQQLATHLEQLKYG